MNEEKPSTLSSILEAAKKEFLRVGYQAAGLRDISKKAGVTTGALYGYFKNKEELFDALVEKAYHGIVDLYRNMLQNFAAIPPENQVSAMMPFSEEGVRGMTDFIYQNRDAFKLILCCSEGTKYNHLIHEMALLNIDATHDFVKVTSAVGVPIRTINPKLEHMITSGMFSTYFEIIIHDIPKEEAQEYISQLLAFYRAGMGKIMGF